MNFQYFWALQRTCTTPVYLTHRAGLVFTQLCSDFDRIIQYEFLVYQRFGSVQPLWQISDGDIKVLLQLHGGGELLTLVCGLTLQLAQALFHVSDLFQEGWPFHGVTDLAGDLLSGGLKVSHLSFNLRDFCYKFLYICIKVLIEWRYLFHLTTYKSILYKVTLTRYL